jgi:Na+/proline symporter
MARLLFLILASLNAVQQVAADCLANKALNDEFASFIPAETIPTEGSCCMKDVCGLPCPTPVEPVSNGYGIAVAIFIGISFLVGMATYFFIKGDAQNYFVAGKSLPLWIVATTLGAQAVDVNSLLTNADLAYKFHFYDGLCIPIGIAGSLILNAIFLAKHVNAEENVLTLPDILSRRYGKTVEVIVSITTITSFLMLLAGNLVGLGTITSYVWGIDQELAIWIAAVIVWACKLL